jgi:hypothetical protein
MGGINRFPRDILDDSEIPGGRPLVPDRVKKEKSPAQKKNGEDENEKQGPGRALAMIWIIGRRDHPLASSNEFKSKGRSLDADQNNVPESKKDGPEKNHDQGGRQTLFPRFLAE